MLKFPPNQGIILSGLQFSIKMREFIKTKQNCKLGSLNDL